MYDDKPDSRFLPTFTATEMKEIIPRTFFQNVSEDEIKSMVKNVISEVFDRHRNGMSRLSKAEEMVAGKFSEAVQKYKDREE